MTLRDIQLVSLDILKDIHDFCTKNNLNYYIAYGTLLGAVRHNGFIPWDDDIDIVMPRPDYERFIKTYKSERGMQLFTYQYSKCLIPYARICEMKRTQVNFIQKPWTKHRTGIFLDIFPLDAVSKDEFDQKKNMAMKLWKRSWSMRYTLTPLRTYKGINKKCKWVTRKIISLLLEKKRITKHINLCKNTAWGKSDYLCQLACPDSNERIIEKKWFDEKVLLQFEDAEFYAPKDWDKILQNIFGDYMQLPPIAEQVPHTYYAKFFWK